MNFFNPIEYLIDRLLLDMLDQNLIINKSSKNNFDSLYTDEFLLPLAMELNSLEFNTKKLALHVPDEIFNWLLESKDKYMEPEPVIKEQIINWVFHQIDNYQKNIDLWKNKIETSIQELPSREREFFKKLTNYELPIKIVFEQKEDIKLKIYQSYSWGEVTLDFADGSMTKGIREGWLWWFEVEKLEEGYIIKLLIDDKHVDYSDLYIIIQGNTWTSTEIRCKYPLLSVEMFDYGFKWERTGWHPKRVFYEISGDLLEKSEALGNWALNREENRLLVLAKIFLMFENKISFLNKEYIKNELRELTSNRYIIDELCSSIESVDYDLALEIRRLAELLEDGHDNLKSIERILIGRKKNSKGRLLFRYLGKMAIEATSKYEDKWKSKNILQKTEEKIKGIFEKDFETMDFDKSFPHYRRVKKGKGEYVSFIIEINEWKEEPSLTMTIALGKGPLKKDKNNSYSLGGIPFDDTTAFDCLYDISKNKYTEIGPSDNGGWFKLDLDSDVNDGELSKYIEVIKAVLNEKSLPKFYLKEHRKSLKKNQLELKLLIIILGTSLFFGFAMWILFILMMPFILQDAPFERNIIFEVKTFGGAGIAFGLLLGVFMYYEILRKGWIS